jgi:hypothetical protein
MAFTARQIRIRSARPNRTGVFDLRTGMRFSLQQRFAKEFQSILWVRIRLDAVMGHALSERLMWLSSDVDDVRVHGHSGVGVRPGRSRLPQSNHE